jgi:predicted phosphodiesterase
MKYPLKIRWDIDVPTVYSNEALICSDVHVPGESDYWINKLIKYGKNQGVRVLFVAGDFWNFDEISRFDVKDHALDLVTELRVGRGLLEEFSNHFCTILVCGNHDKRMPNALDNSLSYSQWVETFGIGNLKATDSDHAFLISNGVKFRVCHPDLYSKVKGSQVTSLSQDLQENVIMGHQHFLSLSTNKTGKYVAIDCGCMCDPHRFQYKRASTSKLPAWENGFIHVKEGKVRLISDYTF